MDTLTLKNDVYGRRDHESLHTTLKKTLSTILRLTVPSAIKGE